MFAGPAVSGRSWLLEGRLAFGVVGGCGDSGDACVPEQVHLFPDMRTSIQKEFFNEGSCLAGYR
jgi:hypothetical protein